MRLWQMQKAGMLPVLVFNFAAGTPVVDSGAAGSSGAEGGAGAGGGGGAGSGTGAGAGSGAPTAPNWESAPAQLREGYNRLKQEHDTLKSQYEPWKGLNVKPEDVTRFHGGYQQVYTEVKAIADHLQINENEIADAIKEHGLLRVLDHLRQEADQAERANAGDQDAMNQRDFDARIREAVDAATKPGRDRENTRMVREANTLVENTITTIATESFKAAGLDFAGAPPELKNFILTGVTEALKYDDDGMREVKFEGKTASIQRAFQTFTAMWDAAYLARRAMETKVGGGGSPRRPGQPPPPPQRQPGAKQPTLEEMADNPDLIRTSQGKAAYSS